MSSPRLAILAILSLAVLPFPASASGGNDLVSCGGGVRATAVGCGKARRIAKEYARTHQHSLWSYSCTSGDNRGRCVLDRKVVTFRLN
jgi:hypothetical protein